jgi:hypothetical protein
VDVDAGLRLFPPPALGEGGLRGSGAFFFPRIRIFNAASLWLHEIKHDGFSGSSLARMATVCASTAGRATT